MWVIVWVYWTCTLCYVRLYTVWVDAEIHVILTRYGAADGAYKYVQDLGQRAVCSGECCDMYA